jgi:RNA polymerase sigma factor (sigma-70 family)
VSESPDDLLSRARDGDPTSERRLFELLHARILSVAKRRLRDEDAASDITQDTLRTVYEKYKTAELPAGFLPWVFTILHHKVGNYLKRLRTERRHLGVTWSSRLIAGDPAMEVDLVESVEKALRAATPECRRVFRLLLSGASASEIGTSFGGEPVGTTYSRVSRCRDRLLRELDRLWSKGNTE